MTDAREELIAQLAQSLRASGLSQDTEETTAAFVVDAIASHPGYVLLRKVEQCDPDAIVAVLDWKPVLRLTPEDRSAGVYEQIGEGAK